MSQPSGDLFGHILSSQLGFDSPPPAPVTPADIPAPAEEKRRIYRSLDSVPVRRSTKREIQEARRRAREKDTRLLAHKQCSECGKSKPILEFPVSGYHKHHPEIPIYRHYCLECQRGKLSQKVFEANAAKLNVLIAAVALDDFLTKHPLPIAYPALDALREHVAVMKRYYRPRPYFREVSPKGDVIIKPRVGRERIVGHGDLP